MLLFARIEVKNLTLHLNAYAALMTKTFGERFQKVTVDAGFTCPNRDGKVARGGCTYCDNKSFNPSYNHSHNPLRWQIEEGIKFHENRYRRANKYIVYFQPYSNTYAPLKFLKKLYEEALSYPNVVGLAIGTRPDCVDDEKLDYLAELNKDKFITIEFGIESIYNKTLDRINRGHSFEQTKEAINMAADRGLHVGSHLIFGLPGESRQMMLDQADVVSKLPLSSMKFHQLQIINRTAMVKDFEANPEDFNLFELDEYIDFIINFIERLNPDFSIERFAGEVPPKFLYSQRWSNLRYDQILNMIEKRLEEKDTWQVISTNHVNPNCIRIAPKKELSDCKSD